MKNLKILFLSLIALSISIIFTPNFSHASDHQVNNQSSLSEAISNAADNGDTITLTDNIVLTSPISITGKTLTINGNGHSISSESSNWTPDGPNGSLITAGGEGTKLTLTNITLTKAQKYGVQSYNGAHVVLNNVTATDNGYGGVLVNAGTVEIINLTLGQNGQYENNGIEIGKGSATGDKIPELIMNGTLTTSEKVNVIYIAQDNEDLTQFVVRNTDSTTNKIFVQGDKVVITDQNNNVLYESNSNSNITFTGDSYVEPSPEVIPPSPEPKVKDETPKTGNDNSLLIAFIVFVITTMSLTALNRKKGL